MNGINDFGRLKVNLTRPLPDEFLGLSPAELEDERARLCMLSIDSADPRDRQYWQTKADDLDRRIARYRDAGVRWPNRSRFDDLTRLARDLKQAVPLEHYIADEVLTTKLERSGDRMKGICPIPTHDDTTPSFVVFPNGRWTSFGQCQRNGDIYTLIGLVFGLTNFRDQVARLADYYRRQVAT